MGWAPKDPNEVVDYGNDWSSILGDETISSSDFTVVSGDVVKDSQTASTTIASVRLSAGTAGTFAEVLNRIVTSGGQTFDQTRTLEIRAR